MVGGVPGRHRITVGGDKNFDTAGFVAALRELNVTPHVAQNTSNRRSAIDGRTTRHPGYAVSQRIRKRIEEAFGWIKEVALQRACPASRQGPRRLAVHPGGRGLQPDPAAQAAGGVRTKAVNRDLYRPQGPSQPRPTVNLAAQNPSRSHPMPKSDAISAAC